MDFLCAAHRAPFEQTCSRFGDATDCTSGGMCRMHVRSVIGHATLDLLTTTNSGAQPTRTRCEHFCRASALPLHRRHRLPAQLA